MGLGVHRLIDRLRSLHENVRLACSVTSIYRTMGCSGVDAAHEGGPSHILRATLAHKRLFYASRVVYVSMRQNICTTLPPILFDLHIDVVDAVADRRLLLREACIFKLLSRSMNLILALLGERV